MERWSVMLVMLLAVAPMARADEASKRAKVQDLFVTMHMDRTMSQLMDMVMKQTRQMANGMPGMDQMTAEQKKVMDDFQKRVEVMVTGSLGWKAMEPEYVTLYAATFSESRSTRFLRFINRRWGRRFWIRRQS